MLIYVSELCPCAVVRVNISAARFDNKACAFDKFPERDGNWTEYIWYYNDQT